MMHSFVASSMPEAQTMSPTGEVMDFGGEAGAPAQDAGQAASTPMPQGATGGSGSTALGSFDQAVGTAESGLQESQGLTDKTGRAIERASTEDAQRQALVDAEKTDVETKGLHSVATMHKDFAPKLDAMDTALSASMSAAQAKTTEAFNTYLQATDDFKKTRIYNWWEHASTGSMILGLLSQIAAGAANGLAGQPGAPTPMDRVIERDLERQKMGLQQKSDNVQNARGVYNDLRGMIKDTVSTDAAFREIAYASVKARADGLAAATNDAAAKGKYLQISADMDRKIGEGRVKAQAYISEKSTKDAFAKSGIAAEFASLFNSRDAAGPKTGTVGMSDVEGDTEAYLKQDPAGFNALSKRTTGGKNALNSIVDLSGLLGDKTLRDSMSTADFNAKANMQLSSFMTSMNSMVELGALSEGDSQKIINQVGIPREFGLVSAAGAKTVAGMDYDSISKRMKIAQHMLLVQMRNTVSAIKVNGKPLKFTWSPPEQGAAK